MIIFKPIGSLDISTSPADLPQQVDGNNIVSGDFQRCKNLRLDHIGVLRQRDGSSKVNETPMAHTIEYIIESGGVRYTFCGDYIYRNEVLITDGVQCATPEYDNDGGDYAADQTVTITSDTIGVEIYYTLDGTTPHEGSQLYVTPVLVPLYSYLKSIAMKDGFLDSSVKSAFYSATGGADLMTEGGDDLYTEGGDDIYTEG
jgi:hypothetical protein